MIGETWANQISWPTLVLLGLRKVKVLSSSSCKPTQVPLLCDLDRTAYPPCYAFPWGCASNIWICGDSYSLGLNRLNRVSADLLGLWLVGKGWAGNGVLFGKAWGSGLISLKTSGVPLPNPLISNIIICRKNSPTLEQDAQNGPQLFLPLLQQAGYPPPKHSPIPSAWSIRQASWMATIRATTSFVDSILDGWMWEESSTETIGVCACKW